MMFGVKSFRAGLVFAALLAAPAMGATCPADAPEGYQWLSGYVDEFRAAGTVNDWFTGSLAQHPDDYALRSLQAFFDAEGDVSVARAAFVEGGGSAADFDTAMACAKVE